ncbi:MBL fold metallo-hydrolase [Alicyclobacillus contaminans]|uniref:MBL fold metallo-hydrolase n=1 Tax=Alicyclobacillus contaminans TaxID=392016 RepID=UPI00041CD5FA|nr:MBL fold metallo-hydrolase [Alicyclobacillus contaminans]
MLTAVQPDVFRLELQTPLPVGSVNAFVVKSADAVVLVDCGLNHQPTRDALVAGLAQLGVRPEDVTAVVLTHGHVDHVGAASLFQEKDVPIYALPGVQTWLQPGGPWEQYRLEFFDALYRTMGLPDAIRERAKQEFFLLQKWNDRSVVNVELHPGETLPWFPDYEVLHVPGHAQAALALWNRVTGELLVGDQLLPHVSSNAFVEPKLNASSGRTADRTRSLLDYRENLRELANMSLTTVYPGHGAPFQGASELIGQRLREQEERRASFFELVRLRPGATAFELATTYFPRHLHQVSLILSESLGYLDWLEADGDVRTQVDETGVVHWYSAH